MRSSWDQNIWFCVCVMMTLTNKATQNEMKQKKTKKRRRFKLELESWSFCSTLFFPIWRWFLISFELTRFHFNEKQNQKIRKQFSSVLIFKLITSIWSWTRPKFVPFFIHLFVCLFIARSILFLIWNELKFTEKHGSFFSVWISFRKRSKKTQIECERLTSNKKTIPCQRNKSRDKSSWSHSHSLSLVLVADLLAFNSNHRINHQ